MIFISVGNNEANFFRLFKNFETIINKNKNIKKKIVCQIGNTNYKNKNFKLIKFLEKKNFLNFLKKLLKTCFFKFRNIFRNFFLVFFRNIFLLMIFIYIILKYIEYISIY
jgi:hypothetical protein